MLALQVVCSSSAEGRTLPQKNKGQYIVFFINIYIYFKLCSAPEIG